MEHFPDGGVVLNPSVVEAVRQSRRGSSGVREAAARRTVAMAQETRLQREEGAYFSYCVRGRRGWSGRR